MYSRSGLVRWRLGCFRRLFRLRLCVARRLASVYWYEVSSGWVEFVEAGWPV